MIHLKEVQLEITKQFVDNQMLLHDDCFYWQEGKTIKYCNHRCSGHIVSELSKGEISFIVKELNDVVQSRQHQYSRGEHGILFLKGDVTIAYLANGSGSLQREVPVEALQVLNLPVKVEYVKTPQCWGLIYSETLQNYVVRPHFTEEEGYGTSNGGDLLRLPRTVVLEECFDTFDNEEEALLLLEVVKAAFSKGKEVMANKVKRVIN